MSDDPQLERPAGGSRSMPIDLAYLLSRAIEEEARAASADDEAAKDAHRRLAEYYRKCAEGRGPPPLPDRSSPSGRLTIF